MPVDPAPAARVAAPLHHVRKLAFLAGGAATWLAVMLIEKLFA